MAATEPTLVLQSITTTNAAALTAISAALVAASAAAAASVAGDPDLGTLQASITGDLVTIDAQIALLDAQILVLTTAQGVLDDYPIEPRPPTEVAFALRDRETRMRQRV